MAAATGERASACGPARDPDVARAAAEAERRLRELERALAAARDACGAARERIGPIVADASAR
jgi:F0F1-type ATP synthase membrane subunit b/b'